MTQDLNTFQFSIAELAVDNIQIKGFELKFSITSEALTKAYDINPTLIDAWLTSLQSR